MKLLWLSIFKILPTSHDIIFTIFSRQFDILINCALAIRASQNLGLRLLITVSRHSFEKATWKENLYFSIINCFQSAVKNPSSKIMLINVKHRFVPKGLLIHYYLYRVLGKNKLHLKFYTNLSSFLILHTPFTDRFYTHLHACRAQYVTVDFISNLFLLQEINSFPKWIATL